jgi:hypothetical protein
MRWNYTIISLESFRSVSVDCKWEMLIKEKTLTETSEPEASKHRTKCIFLVTAAIIFAAGFGSVV